MTFSPPPEYAQRVNRALSYAGLSQTTAAEALTRRIGKLVKPQVVQYMASKASSARLTADLASICGVRYAWLAHGIGEMPADEKDRDVDNGLKGGDERHTEPSEADLAVMAEMREPPIVGFGDALELLGKGRGTLRKVPVVGSASLGLDGFWSELEYPVGHGDGFMEHFSSDANAYALRVRGDSMFPAIRDGNIVVVEPNTPPVVGEFVMVQLHDGRSTVKEFLWHKGGVYAFQAVNGQARLTLDESQVSKVHFVGAILPGSKVRNYT